MVITKASFQIKKIPIKSKPKLINRKIIFVNHHGPTLKKKLTINMKISATIESEVFADDAPSANLSCSFFP